MLKSERETLFGVPVRKILVSWDLKNVTDLFPMKYSDFNARKEIGNNSSSTDYAIILISSVLMLASMFPFSNTKI